MEVVIAIWGILSLAALLWGLHHAVQKEGQRKLDQEFQELWHREFGDG